jgi:hypothetical protein
MTPEQKRLAEAVQSGAHRHHRPPHHAGRAVQPLAPQPRGRCRLQALGEELHFRSSIAAALHAFAIRITAREWSSQHE